MTTPGIIQATSIPGWPTPTPGLLDYIKQQGILVEFAPEGVYVSDLTSVQTIISSFSGSANELQYWQARWQTNLDNLLDNNFDLVGFIRAGTNSSVTATNIGNFLATITNNYRSLRAQIAAATSVAQVQAINLNAGWPSNP